MTKRAHPIMQQRGLIYQRMWARRAAAAAAACGGRVRLRPQIGVRRLVALVATTQACARARAPMHESSTPTATIARRRRRNEPSLLRARAFEWPLAN